MQIAVCDDEREIREMFAEKIGKLYPKADLSLHCTGRGRSCCRQPKSRISCCLTFRCRAGTAWKRQRNCAEQTKR